MTWHDGVTTSIAGPLTAGLVAIAVGFGGFGTWAATAPLNGAVVAPGKIIACGNNKVVQHLEGGIVKEVFVREGESVKAGDPLLSLDKTAALANFNQLQLRSLYFQAAAARAQAERDGKDAITYPASFRSHGLSAEARKIIADQEAEFSARRASLDEEIAVADQQIAQLQDRISGYRKHLEELGNQIALVGEERTGFEKLLEQQLTAKSRVLDLKRAESDLRSQEGRVRAAISEASKSIAEIREGVERERTKRIEGASKELNEIRANLSDVQEKLRAAEDISSRSILRSPASGKVINASEFNPGAVISPGQKIMEIVPNDSDLIAQARVRPQDVDDVAIGQKAELVLSYTTRDVPPVAGEVTYISADRLEDQQGREAYYIVRVKFDASDIDEEISKQFAPGLPVEALITTRERTFLSYVTDPIRKTIVRSMREN